MIASSRDRALLEAWEEAREREDITTVEFAKRQGITPKAIDCALYKARKDRELVQKFSGAEYKKINMELIHVDIGSPWTLEGDRLVVGDTHVPKTDWGMAAMVAQVGKKMLRRPRRLLIAGDLLNLDVLGMYAMVVPTPDWKQERAAARALLREWLETFDEIDMIMGNHDRRWQRATAALLDEEDLRSVLASDPRRFRISVFGWCNVVSGGVNWRVTHPRNYSVNQLTVADQLAQKFQTNIISFHEHHLALGWDRYGNYVVVNGGCLAEADQEAYKTLDDSKHANWNKGFVLLKDGTPQLFGEPPFTDWSKFIK